MKTGASDRKKQRAAERAAALVESGMVLGLGSGTTAAAVVVRIAALIQEGALHDLRAVPTSKETARTARRCGVPTTTLNRAPVVDLTIDGADEVDGALNLIKGAGGALFREKMVAQASRRLVIVADDTKCVDRLGSRRSLPLEVIPLAKASVRRMLLAMGAGIDDRLNPDGTPFVTDNGNRIFDARFGPISDPYRLSDRLDRIAGIAAHGLFLDLADELIVASETEVRHRIRQEPKRT